MYKTLSFVGNRFNEAIARKYRSSKSKYTLKKLEKKAEEKETRNEEELLRKPVATQPELQAGGHYRWLKEIEKNERRVVRS